MKRILIGALASALLPACAATTSDGPEHVGDEPAALGGGGGIVVPPPPQHVYTHFVSVQPADGIQSAYAVENRPVHIKYSVYNGTSSTRTGWVTAQITPTNAAAYNTDTWGYVTLAPGATATGVLTFMAPPANDATISSHIIDLDFVEEVPSGGEFPNYVNWWGDEETFDSGARFWIGMDNFHVTTTRAQFQDTDYVTVSGQVNGAPVFSYTEKTAAGRKYGLDCCGSGNTYYPRIYFPADSLRHDGATPVQFFYNIANAGNPGPDLQTVLDDLSHVGAGVATYFVPTAAPLWVAVDQVVNLLIALGTADCDGVVAQKAISLSDLALYTGTANTDVMPFTDAQPGTPSPNGCGATSNYKVGWSATRHRPGNDAITITPSHATLSANQTVQLTYKWPDEYSGVLRQGDSIAWAVAGGPANGWVDANGLYHAPAQVNANNASPAHYVVVTGTGCELRALIQGDPPAQACHTQEAYISLR
jgi:hypothetical protein